MMQITYDTNKFLACDQPYNLIRVMNTNENNTQIRTPYLVIPFLLNISFFCLLHFVSVDSKSMEPTFYKNVTHIDFNMF